VCCIFIVKAIFDLQSIECCALQSLSTAVLSSCGCQIHGRGLTEFTAQQLIGGEIARINIDEQIPSDPQLCVVITAVSENWVWKIEDSAISYHPRYRGEFGPRWDD